MSRPSRAGTSPVTASGSKPATRRKRRLLRAVVTLLGWATLIFMAVLAVAVGTALLKATVLYRPLEPEHLAEKQTYLESVAGARDPEAPNIIVILFDDLGYGDLSSYGNRLIRTPEIDALAAEGVRLTSFYSVSPICTPARAGLMTGRYPVRAHSNSRAFLPSDRKEALARRLQGLENAIPRDEILLAEPLRSAGYHTGLIGKWHLGDLEGHLPNDLGFDDYYGVLSSNDLPELLDLYRNKTLETPWRDVDPASLTPRYTAEAIDFITANRERPFFLYLAHTYPHIPHFATAAHRGTSEGGLYGDVVEDLDRSVGAIMDSLRENGLEKNTLVIVTSDNGADLNGSTGGLRGHKGDTFEGGQRVPFIAFWPGEIEAGREIDGMAMTTDLFPTLLDLAGIPLPADRIIDGKDILPMLRGEAPTPHEELFYFEMMRGAIWGVRTQRYKYNVRQQKALRNPAHPLPNLGRFLIDDHFGPMLNDLELDTEYHDLSLRHPEIATDLRGRIERKEAELAENLRGWR